jgi:hypothetical protein
MNQLTMKYANNKEEITKELRHFFDALRDHDAMFGSLDDFGDLISRLYSNNEEAFTVLSYTQDRITGPRHTRVPKKICEQRFLKYGFDACMSTLELFIAFEHMNRVDNINKEKEEEL